MGSELTKPGLWSHRIKNRGQSPQSWFPSYSYYQKRVFRNISRQCDCEASRHHLRRLSQGSFGRPGCSGVSRRNCCCWKPEDHYRCCNCSKGSTFHSLRVRNSVSSESRYQDWKDSRCEDPKH